MTTTAAVNNYTIAQARLGTRVYGGNPPSSDPAAGLREVAGAVFTLLERDEEFWLAGHTPAPAPIYGHHVGDFPDSSALDIPGLRDYFRTGFTNFSSLWKELLEKEEFSVLEAIFSGEAASLPGRCWVRIVYGYAARFHHTPRQKYQLLTTLAPIYAIRLASLAGELGDHGNPAEHERVLARHAALFAEEKPYLIDLWTKEN